MLVRRAQLDLPLGPTAPRTARLMVLDALDGWGITDLELRDGAALVVSELVTNAFLHGGGQIALQLDEEPGAIRVSVSDGNSVLPHQNGHGTLDGRGRGLVIVGALASEWGTQRHEGGGKEVWVRLSRAAAARI
jgi:anti-sigma regulatory factor (Ser/Thr protein kinase)